MLVMGHKLDQPTGTGLKGLSLLVHDLKVDGIGRLGGHTAHLPGRSVTDTNLSFSYRGGLFVGRDCMSNQSTNLEFLGGLFFKQKKENKLKTG